MEKRRCAGCMNVTQEYICEHCGSPGNLNNEPHQLPVGTVLRGQYMVGRVLGQGGFGITYLGWDAYLEAPVAIKEYYPSYMVGRDHSVTRNVRCYTAQLQNQYAASKARFLREARTLAKFQDEPSVVHIRSCFEENETAYIIMEYLRGETLASLIARSGPMKAETLLNLLTPVMKALEDVHKANMVHRDISPDNIMIAPDGKAKLLDFGAARDSSNGNTTETVVKHGFAPFEQYQNKGELGPWTDVYALCATIYYCLTGKIPVEALTLITNPEALDWSGVPGLTDGQREALTKGMAATHKTRTQSVGELMKGLCVNQAPQPRQEDVRRELRIQVEQELRTELRPQVEHDLRVELRPQIEHALRQELLRQNGAVTNPSPVQNGKSRVKTDPSGKKKLGIVPILVMIAVLLAVLAAGILVLRANSMAGWAREEGGYRYYEKYGGRLTNAWYLEEDIYYYFDDDGYMVTGFCELNGYTYYFGESDGRMRTGWQRIGAGVYYFGESDGRMRTGKAIVDGVEYTFSERGKLVNWPSGKYPEVK